MGYLIPVWVLAIVCSIVIELLSLLSLSPNNEFSHISWILILLVDFLVNTFYAENN